MDVTLRTMRRQRRSGLRVFYVTSLSGRRREYAVRHVRQPGRRRWDCSCPDYFHRASVARRHCKHIRLVRDWVDRIGGLRQARPELSLTVETPVQTTLFEGV